MGSGEFFKKFVGLAKKFLIRWGGENGGGKKVFDLVGGGEEVDFDRWYHEDQWFFYQEACGSVN